MVTAADVDGVDGVDDVDDVSSVNTMAVNTMATLVRASGAPVHYLQQYIDSSSPLADSFWTDDVSGLDKAETPVDLPPRTLAALGPLLRFFSRFDVVTLPNSRERKLSNLFHVARYVHNR